MDRYNRSIPLVILCLLLCFALLLFSGAAQGGEDDSTVKAQPGNVDKDGQVSGEEAKLPANITVEGDEDELIRIHSMSLTPEGGWKFRAFTEDEKKPGALDITGSGKDYVDIEDGNPTPQSPTASIHGGKDHLTASAAFPEDQVDAGDYPLRMEGNLTGGEAGEGGGGEPEERHWAAKSQLRELDFVNTSGKSVKNIPSVDAVTLAKLTQQSNPETGPPESFPPTRPPGIYTTLSGTVAVGQLEEDGTRFLTDQISSESLSRLRFEGSVPGSPGTITVTLSSSSDSRDVTLSKESFQTYVSDRPIVAFNGNLGQQFRQEVESSLGIWLIHNETVEAEFGNITTSVNTFQLSVDFGQKEPNILVANGSSTTEILFKDTNQRQGVKVKFSVDNGTIENDVKTTDENGVVRATYTSSNATSTATVTATVLDDNNENETSLQTYVYNEKYNFKNLSQNDDLGNYNDTTFTNNNSMSQQDIQDFLEDQNSFLAIYSTGGKTAAEIIKIWADTESVNPKIILVTLQKEQGLVSEENNPGNQSPRLKEAMGVPQNIANGFAEQVEVGTKTLDKWYDAGVSYLPVKSPRKRTDAGALVEGYFTQNHIYVVPSTGNKNVWVAVAFTPDNKSTFTQHKYTNFITHRRDEDAQRYDLPVGGVYTFLEVWEQYFPDQQN